MDNNHNKSGDLDAIRIEASEFFRRLLRVMSAFQTRTCVDAQGNFWSIGRWYGWEPHFRTNFGHWSEKALNWDDPMFLTLEPWVNHTPPTEEQKAWGAFYENFSVKAK